MNTRDLSKFGFRELEIAKDLMSKYKTDKDLSNLEKGVSIEFNLNSGYVFLVDGEYNVAMINGEFLENFHSCPECGNEGFSEDLKDGNRCCIKFIKQVS